LRNCVCREPSMTDIVPFLDEMFPGWRIPFLTGESGIYDWLCSPLWHAPSTCLKVHFQFKISIK
jgi:hypothetical protein